MHSIAAALHSIALTSSVLQRRRVLFAEKNRRLVRVADRVRMIGRDLDVLGGVALLKVEGECRVVDLDVADVADVKVAEAVL